MKNTSAGIALLILLGVGLLSSCDNNKPAVLVFSETKGYRHESITAGKLALIELGKSNGFRVDTTEDSKQFNEANLAKYNAVIFLSTTLDVLDLTEQGSFKRFIEAGGGFVGIHAAADTEYEWPWYGKLVGAYFKSHPEIQEAKLVKSGDFGTEPVKDTWVRKDEWYNYKQISTDINVIYSLDETSYKGGQNGSKHPIAWYHDFEGGRSFYTGLGHTTESYTDPEFLNHILGGIKYAIGASKPDFSKAKSKPIAEDTRFTKTVLDFNLDEPTEMTFLPDGKIVFVERKGAVKLYDPATSKVTTINTLKVGTKFEDGIIGIATDPNFATNHFLYLFYSHPERSSNIVSRFTFLNNQLDISTEKEIIEVPTQRETCCHTGGSLAFGPDGNLFISTGDNTSPFESDGFSPSDEGKGRSPFDAQKSSANTNDLRGKILRIKVKADGTYDIPDGNLFPKGEAKTRPEIYVMGTRNPYRISIDDKTGFLYWGEVGPDAGENDSIRGPRGYDELNQAKGPGFFGWPYFVGNNYPYAHFDFTNKKVIDTWDPGRPVNNSPNNTGKTELPAVSPAFIYYPYAASDEFPMLKTGSRNAMAGPFYYSEKYKDVKTAFPDYFDGKLIFYDWMRNWIFLVTMKADGSILDIEPFMANTKFNNISDMAYGPDGRLYMLEYGTGWFKQNLDARLVRIDYNGGNRTPVAALQASVTSGSIPFNVAFTTNGTVDYDNEKLVYSLAVADNSYQSDDGKFEVRFDKSGVYDAVLTVTDVSGNSATATTKIIAGNTPPDITIDVTKGNKTFYLPDQPTEYKVSVKDKEDGSAIVVDKVKVTYTYVKGFDMTAVAQGHQKAPLELPGKALIEASDCKACHLVNQRSAGPSYLDVAKRYATDKEAVDKLAAKIIKGGAGVWGTTEMAAHPQISVEDSKLIVQYILSLESGADTKFYPTTGKVTPGNEKDGVYVLAASYEDGGSANLPSLGSTSNYVFRSTMLKARETTDLHLTNLLENNNPAVLENIKHTGHAAYTNLDLTGIKGAAFIAFIDKKDVGGEIELHLDKPDGTILGKGIIRNSGLNTVPITFNVTGVHNIYVVFVNKEAGEKTLYYFAGLQLTY